MIRAIHAEWTKLRTMPGTGWLLLAIVAASVAASWLASAIVKCPASCGTDTTKLSLTGILLGQAAVAILAIEVIAPEYSTGMIQVTLTAVPRRARMLAAKAIVLTGLVAGAGILAVLGGLLAGRILQPGNGFSAARGFAALSLTHGPTLRAAIGSVLYLALIGLLSLGAASVLRDSAVAMTLVLGLLYLVPLLGDVLLSHPWQHRIERWGPANAGLAIQATRNLARLPIGPWPGLGVLAAWAAGAMLLGYLLLRLRDA
jgi:ABC-2 type transport system permease protein